MFKLKKRKTLGRPGVAYKQAGKGHFTKVTIDQKEDRFRLDIRNLFLIPYRHQHRLSKEVVDVPSLELFNAWLDWT